MSDLIEGNPDAGHILRDDFRCALEAVRAQMEAFRLEGAPAIVHTPEPPTIRIGDQITWHGPAGDVRGRIVAPTRARSWDGPIVLEVQFDD